LIILRFELKYSKLGHIFQRINKFLNLVYEILYVNIGQIILNKIILLCILPISKQIWTLSTAFDFIWVCWLLYFFIWLPPATGPKASNKKLGSPTHFLGTHVHGCHVHNVHVHNLFDIVLFSDSSFL